MRCPVLRIRALAGIAGIAAIAAIAAVSPVHAQEAAERVNLPLPEYLDLVRRAREAAATPPSLTARTTTLASQRVDVRVDGDRATLISRFEIDVRTANAASGGEKPNGGGNAALLLPVGGRITSVRAEAASANGPRPTLFRSGSGELTFWATTAGRYTVEVTSRVERAADASETFAIPTRTGVAPISELRVELPAAIRWKLAGAITLEERVDDATTPARRKLRLAIPRGNQSPFEIQSGVAATPTTPATTLARSIVITHLDLRADEVLYRLDTVQVEVLRGEIARLEARLPAGVVVERAWMDDGSDVTIATSATATVVGGNRKQRLSGSGFLKILTRRAGAPPPELAFGAIEPSVAARARYLVVSSSVAATLTPKPAETWSTIDLTDPPDSLERELAERPPVGGWRLEKADPTAALAIGLLPAVARIPLPINERETTTLVNADGTLLIQDRFEIADARDALDLTLPEGMRFESATVDGDVVRPIERDGRHLLPLRFRGEGTTTVEISLTNRSLTAQKRAARRRFALPKLPAGAGGEVLRHTWHLYLPPGMEGRYQQGELRPAPRPIHLSIGQLRDADVAEESWSVDGVVAIPEAPAAAAPRMEAGATISESDLERVPTSTDTWKSRQEAPGVRTDPLAVGGAESVQQSFNRAGTAIEVKPSLQPAPGSTEFLFTGALPPREVGVELEIKEKKAKRW